MWNRIKREGFLPSSDFHSSVSQCFCLRFFLSLLQTLSLWDPSFNRPVLIWVIVPFLFAPIFCERRQRGAFSLDPPAEGSSMGIKSALLNFADGSLWTVNSCFSFHPPPCAVITPVITLTIIILITIALTIIFNHPSCFDHSIFFTEPFPQSFPQYYRRTL